MEIEVGAAKSVPFLRDIRQVALNQLDLLMTYKYVGL